nr:hypothetical protein [Tanacetum cinerariifolium]
MAGDDNNDGDHPKTSNTSPPIPSPTQQILHTVSSIKLPILKKEGLHKGYDRFQTLLSQLEIHGAGVLHEDANQKFLRSLLSFWSQVALIMRTKPGLDTLSFDDLYNNLRVFKRDVKSTTASSSNTQNAAFVSADNTSSTNDVSTAYSVSSLSVLKSQKEGSSSYTDEINNDDMEEMDLKWQLVVIRPKWNASIAIKIGHFSRYWRAKGNQNSRKRDVGYNGNKTRDNGRRPAYQNESKALVTIDEEDIDWSGHTSADESDSKPGEHASCESDSSVETSTSMPEPVENASKVVYEPKVWTDASIIEEYESDSDNDLVSNVQEDKENPSFAFTDSVQHVKTSRENIQETGTTNHNPKIEKQNRNAHTRKGLGYVFTRKACFVCDFHEKRMDKQAELTKSKNKDDPHRALKDKGIIDSGCSRHMTGNKAYLADY